MFYYFMDYWYIILVVPALIFSLIAQAGVNSAYRKYSKKMSRKGITGREMAERVLQNNGIYDVSIEPVSGKMTDHYDPKAKVIRLSEGVYNSNSVAAIGIASHEAGHAVQHNVGYGPIKIRNSVLPVAQIGSTLSMPLILIGFIFNFAVLVNAGIIFFSLVVLFQLITLPVEFDASSRALKAIEGSAVLEEEEFSGAKKVLNAAAMTYVAALAVSLAQLLRLILLTNRRND